MGSDQTAKLLAVTPLSESRVEPAGAMSTDNETSGLLPRSCHACHRKKVKCDRQQPCSPCLRTGKPCAFPPSGPRIRRTKKAIMADMSARIHKLEKSLAAATESRAITPSAHIIETPGGLPNTPPVTPLGSDVVSVVSVGSQEDNLVRKGLSTQHFDDTLSGAIGSNQDDDGAVPLSQSVALRPPACSPFSALGILSSPSPTIAPITYLPHKPLCVKLWKTYVDNVEGCVGSQMLHLPTEEVKIYSAISDPASASVDYLALLFAMFYFAVITVNDTEAQIILGQDKSTLLHQFKAGFEQALAHGDILDRPTIIGLQALMLHLTALRLHNRGKGIWVLNGLVVRIAQSLGLHRDGAVLGLSPFESEIRRRIWWRLLVRDARAGEDYGLENANCLLFMSDVSLPSNIDDVDLHPGLKRLPPPKKGWTPTTYLLVTINLARSMQKLCALAAASSPTSPPSEPARTKIIEETTYRVETLLELCNNVLPSQRQVLLCSRFQLRKLEFATRIQWALLQHTGFRTDLITERTLIEALEILDTRLPAEDEMLQQYTWAKKAYPQYHVTMYVLWHLCIRPHGPSTNRAWEAVERQFATDLDDESIIGYGSKSAVLAALKSKAMAARDTPRPVSEGPGCIYDAANAANVAPGASGNAMQGDELAPGNERDSWPDWEMLVQGFQLDSSDGFW